MTSCAPPLMRPQEMALEDLVRDEVRDKRAGVDRTDQLSDCRQLFHNLMLSSWPDARNPNALVLFEALYSIFA